MKHIVEDIFNMIFGFFAYMAIEILFRGYTYWLMGLLGAVCFFIIGNINEKRKKEIGIIWQGIIGMLVITTVELIVGSILDIYGIRMWSYEDRWLNCKGLICPAFSMFWFILSIAVVILDDTLRCIIFKEKWRNYKWI